MNKLDSADWATLSWVTIFISGLIIGVFMGLPPSDSQVANFLRFIVCMLFLGVFLLGLKFNVKAAHMLVDEKLGSGGFGW